MNDDFIEETDGPVKMSENARAIDSTQNVDDFRAKLEQMDALPSLTNSVMELLRCLDIEETTDATIVDLISQDTGLTARLLKLANSASMGLRYYVTSIERAVPLLGRNHVRQICLGGGVWDALAKSAEKANFDLAAFELHSLTVAELAQFLARRSGLPETEDVFASALLHDLGKFLLLSFDGEAYAKTLVEAAETKANLEDLEYDNIGWTHTRVGGWLTDHWGLPGAVRESVKLHHQPKVAMNGKHGPLVSLICVANNLSKVIKRGNSGNQNIESIGPFLKPLDLTPDDLKAAGDMVKAEKE